jgi:predicted O-methyltransferase YrrM
MNNLNEYKYTKARAWFLGSEIRRYILNYLDNNTQNDILEIGCYEGLSSVFFSDNLLNHINSSMTCVDPFLLINNDHAQFLTSNEEKNFDFNINNCKNSDKITVLKITSDEFFKNNTEMYNFIYIDGCHEIDYINRDMENSFKSLKKNGIMWMDDYMGGGVEEKGQIKRTMDAFLNRHNGEFKLIHKGYQLAIKKL